MGKINPKDFKVTSDMLRGRLSLSDSAVIVSFGYEGILDKQIITMLQSRYDVGSLFIRTRPDFFVIDNDDLYFVEAKQRTKNVEALQLLYNRQHERMGIKVLYSFPEITVHAVAIPMDTIIVPENHRDKFDSNLKHLFEAEGVKDFQYIGHLDDWSGDAYVQIKLEDMQILSPSFPGVLNGS